MFSDNLRGAFFMSVAMAGLTLNDSFIKSIGKELPLFQIIGIRGLIATVILFLFVAFWGQLHFKPSKKSMGLIAGRCVCDILATVFFFQALFNMPLSTLTAVLQIIPLTVTLAAAIFLRESVGWRRWLAVLIGLIGATLIIQPGTANFNMHSWWILACVVAASSRDIFVRSMSVEIPSLYIAFFNALSITLVTLLVASFYTWEPVESSEMMRMSLAAIFLVIGYSGVVAAMRFGEIGSVAPFRYVGLIVALIVGYAYFGERLDLWSWIGIVLLVVSGGFALSRENKRQKKAATLKTKK